MGDTSYVHIHMDENRQVVMETDTKTSRCALIRKRNLHDCAMLLESGSNALNLKAEFRFIG